MIPTSDRLRHSARDRTYTPLKPPRESLINNGFFKAFGVINSS